MAFSTITPQDRVSSAMRTVGTETFYYDHWRQTVGLHNDHNGIDYESAITYENSFESNETNKR
jgi:hypothetical protein